MITNLTNLAGPNNAEEPAQYRGITKALMYTTLSDQYLLPAVDSKGVNKQYLIQIAEGLCYRLPILDFKRFEIDLVPKHWKKVSYLNLSILVQKLNSLLRERNELELGFPANIVPEETWLIKVTRYLDQENLLEIFVHACPHPIPVDTLTRRVHQAKVIAQNFLFGQNPALRSPKIVAQLEEISDIGRRIYNRRTELLDLQRYIIGLEGKIVEDEALLRSGITKASVQILSVGQRLNAEDDIFIDGEDGQEFRQSLTEISRL